jgi:flagellar motor switch protein FliM
MVPLFEANLGRHKDCIAVRIEQDILNAEDAPGPHP